MAGIAARLFKGRQAVLMHQPPYLMHRPCCTSCTLQCSGSRHRLCRRRSTCRLCRRRSTCRQLPATCRSHHQWQHPRRGPWSSYHPTCARVSQLPSSVACGRPIPRPPAWVTDTQAEEAAPGGGIPMVVVVAVSMPATQGVRTWPRICIRTQRCRSTRTATTPPNCATTEPMQVGILLIAATTRGTRGPQSIPSGLRPRHARRPLCPRRHGTHGPRRRHRGLQSAGPTGPCRLHHRIHCTIPMPPSRRRPPPIVATPIGAWRIAGTRPAWRS